MSLLFNIRMKRKLTQQQMADIICISRPTYKLWEDYPEKIPLGYLKRIINSFDVNKNELLDIFGYVGNISFFSDIKDIRRDLIDIRDILNRK